MAAFRFMLSSNAWPSWSSWANRRRFANKWAIRPASKGRWSVRWCAWSPGTLTDAALLDDKTDNRLLALVFQQGVLGIAWLSLASGEFVVQETRAEHCLSELERLRPAEILVADNARLAVLEQVRAPIKRLPPWQFERASASERLARHLPCRIWPALARKTSARPSARRARCWNTPAPARLAAAASGHPAGGNQQPVHPAGRRHPAQSGADRNHSRRGRATLFSLLDQCATSLGGLAAPLAAPPCATTPASAPGWTRWKRCCRRTSRCWRRCARWPTSSGLPRAFALRSARRAICRRCATACWRCRRCTRCWPT